MGCAWHLVDVRMGIADDRLVLIKGRITKSILFAAHGV